MPHDIYFKVAVSVVLSVTTRLLTVMPVGTLTVVEPVTNPAPVIVSATLWPIFPLGVLNANNGANAAFPVVAPDAAALTITDDRAAPV